MAFLKPFARNEKTPDLFERLQVVLDAKLEKIDSKSGRSKNRIDTYSNGKLTATVYSSNRDGGAQFPYYINIKDITDNANSSKKEITLSRHTDADKLGKSLVADIKLS